MKVLITGGAGFIGSHLCARFLERGDEVVAFDNLILGRREFLQPFAANKHFQFIEADLTDLARVQSAMRGIDLVVHMAANSDISQGAARTDVDMQNGTVATYNVLEAMRVHSVKQLIFASTSALYGDAEVKPTPESYGPLLPISFYGASKLACEAMISAFSHNCGISAWMYRFANIVGSHSTHGAIHDFVKRLLAARALGQRAESDYKLQVLGNGTQRKSYLHVSDCVDGMLFGFDCATSSASSATVNATVNATAGGGAREALHAARAKGHEHLWCFNLASVGVTTVRTIAEEVVAQLATVTGQRSALVFGESDRGWVGDVPYTHLDGAKFAALGWTAKLSSDEAVRRAVGEVIAEQLAKANGSAEARA